MEIDESGWELDKFRFVDDATRAGRDGVAPLRDHGFRLGPLALQFAQLTYSLLDAHTIGDVLEQVVAAAKEVLPGADVVSVSLRDADGHFHTPITTDPIGYDLDRLQQQFAEGPCWDAARDPGPAIAYSDHLADEPAWPRFAPSAVQLGARAVCSVTLPANPATTTPGALNVFSRQPHGLRDVDQNVVLLLATHASLALAHAQAVEMATLKQAHLERGLDSRDVIGQAKGILMARQNISADAAFDILRRTSQDLNTKLIEIADTLVTRHQDLDR